MLLVTKRFNEVDGYSESTNNNITKSIVNNIQSLLIDIANMVEDALDGDVINLTGDYTYLEEFDNTIVNGIVINIDNKLKKLLDLSLGECDRVDILNEIISISNSIRYNSDNKVYFMGMIKKIYENIRGDEL